LTQTDTAAPREGGIARPRAAAGRTTRRLVARWHALAEALRTQLERELGERIGFQWLAVAFAIGSAVYFALPAEPPLAPVAAGVAIAAIVAVRGYARGTSWRLAAIVALVLAGAAAAKLRVDALTGPAVEESRYVELMGRVVAADARVGYRPRVVLDRLTVEATDDDALPSRIRLSFAESYGMPPLGARIAVRAELLPLSGPAVPGGYDPRRAAFFERIGGTGYLLGRWEFVEAPAGMSLRLFVDRVREDVSARIAAIDDGQAGGVAAALLVGDRSGISAATSDHLRRAGLAHLLAISGLHMMLFAGTSFFLVRGILAMLPGFALRHPIRKWAALAAILSGSLYLALSGGSVSTIRAFVMALVMFVAILVDRPAISMRNVALAVLVVVALQPESVVEPGFQMSFFAAGSLVAAWEAWRARRTLRLADDDLFPGFRLARRAWGALVAVAVTTVVAGLATAPFAAYHFARIEHYSLLGNILAAPITSLVIMPAGLIGLAAMPLGLEAAPIGVMVLGIEGLLAVAAFVADLPGAEQVAPPMSTVSLALIVAGMLWLCLWRERWRLLGIPLVASGIALVPILADPPAILVAPDGRAVAVRDAGGTLRVSGSRAGTYIVGQFFEEETRDTPPGAALREGVRCDPLACLLNTADGRQVSHILDPAAFAEDCTRAAIVVTPLTAPADCAARLIVDGPRLARYGAHAVRLGDAAGRPSYLITTAGRERPRAWEAGGAPRAFSISAEAP
jgi:competence protein ComEC